MRKTVNKKKQICLSEIQKDILIGTLLGDGWLETATKDQTYRYGFKQKLEQQSYVYSIYDCLRNLCGTKPRLHNTDFQFKTLTQPILFLYGRSFYGLNHKKKVPQKIMFWLTRRALAYWYMDDRSKEKKKAQL